MQTITPSSQLWVSDPTAVKSLAHFFKLYSPLGQPNNPIGHHTLAFDPDTPEKVWKAIAYRLLSAGCTVGIAQVGFCTNQPLEWFLSDPASVDNLALQLMEGEIPWSEWVEALEAPLVLKEALELAELAISKLKDKEQDIELDALRRRAGVSEYKWDKQCLPSIRNQPARQTDSAQQLKLELLALNKEADPVRKVLCRAKIATHYNIRKDEVEFLSRTIDSDTKTPKAQFHALDDFLSMESEGIDYLIPGLLPRGETVLCCGLPKSGKTLLAIDAGFAIATGESHFLGEAVQQGRVLLISVDESAQSTKAKLLKRGFRPRDGANMTVMTAWDISQLDALEAKLEDFRPDVVIIDSLKRITVGREISENSAEFADILYTLKELIGRYGAAGILIHHSNKNQEATGVAKVRGSTAIAGAVWGIWQVDIPESDDESKNKPSKGKSKQKRFDPTNPNRIFTAICRDTEGALLNIRFNPENNSYAISETDETARANSRTQEQVILDILAQAAPRGLTGREIMSYSNLGRGVYSVLNRLVDKRLITQRQSKTDHRMTVYCLLASKGTPPLPHCLSLCDQLSSNGNQGMDLEIDHKLITNQEELITKFCKNDQKSSDVINLNLEPVSPLAEIDHKNATERGGEGVPPAITEINSSSITHEQSSEPSALVAEEKSMQQTELPIYQRSDRGFGVTQPKAQPKAPMNQLDEIAAHFPELSFERQLLEIDYSEFPMDEPRASEEVKSAIALTIRAKILEIDSAEDYQALRASKEFSREQLNWVRRNCLLKVERENFQLLVTGSRNLRITRETNLSTLNF